MVSFYCNFPYGVATISRLLKFVGLFCNRDLLKSLYSAEESCSFKEPTNCSQPISVVWLVHMCDMTPSCMWHESFIYVTWLICVPWLTHMCDVSLSHVRHDSFIRVTGLMHMYDMTHSYVWQHSGIHMCDMAHSYVWHDSSICVTWLILMYNLTRSYVWHGSFICGTW